MSHRTPPASTTGLAATRFLRACARAVLPARRRGSILVLVLGIIALLALLAVLFAAIGKSDRQSGAALVRQDQLKSVPEQVRDYIADVIARDALATFPAAAIDPQTGRPEMQLHREAFDYPWTDPAMLSTPAPADREHFRFDPAGDFRSVLPLAAERRQPSDPWLGVTEPANLDPDDDSAWGSPPVALGPGAEDFFYRRDIVQMSNFAPDGRAVNLFNIRNNLWIASGVDPSNTPGSAGSTISSGLTLYDQNLDVGFGLIGGGTADPNVPAHWFTNQRAAFRPLTDPNWTWRDASFAPYQYADADGDGIVDSRLIELVDATDPNNPISLLETRDEARYFVAIHAEDLSARVNVNTAGDFTDHPGYSVDLANPFLGPSVGDGATGDFYAGFTPADISLFRMLRLEDAYLLTGGVGYLGLESPRLPDGQIDINSWAFYGVPDPGQFAATDLYSNAVRASVGQAAYELSQFTRLTGHVPPVDIVQSPSANGLEDYARDTYFGAGSYPILERVIPDFPRDWLYSAQGRAVTYLADAGASAGAAWGNAVGNSGDAQLLAGFYGLDSLLELLTFNGVNDPATLSPLEAVLGGRFFSPGDDTLRFDPLRSNRPLSAERGDRDRYEYNGASTPNGRLDFDAMVHAFADLRRRLTTHSGARPILSTPVADRDQLHPRELRSHIRNTAEVSVPTLGSIELSFLDTPRWLFQTYADALAPHIDADGAWSGAPGTDTLFYGYRGPEFPLRVSAAMTAHLVDALDADTVHSAFTVLLDENFRASLQADSGNPLLSRAAPWAWWYNGGSGRMNVPMGLDLNDTHLDGDWDGQPDWPSPDEPRIRPRLANTPGASWTAGSPTAPVVNVYGFEPQPVITEVAAYSIITDAPASAGGDKEWEQGGGPPPPGPIGDVEQEGIVTIDSDVIESNPDFIAQFLAIQVTNPWGRPISLGRYIGDPTDPEHRTHLYYLEFAGRFYPLSGVPLTINAAGDVDYQYPAGGGGPIGGANLQPREIVLAPGDTKVFVIASQTLTEIEERINDVDGDASQSRIGNVGAFIRSQMAPDSDGDGDADVRDVVIIERMYDTASPRRAIPFPENEFRGMQDPSVVGFTDVFRRPVLDPGGGDVDTVRLWRVLRNADSNDLQNFADEIPGDPRLTNIEDNDLLIDRLRAPENARFNVSLSLVPDSDPAKKGHAISGATARDENGPDPGYNTGITIITWSSVRRPGTMSAGSAAGRRPLFVPPYALEVRSSGSSMNAADDDEMDNKTGLTVGDLSRADMFDSWNDFWDRHVDHPANPGVPRRVAKLRDHPERKLGNPIANHTSASGKSFNELQVEMVQNLSPELLRATDFLLPLGIGASYNPSGGNRDERWVTFGEALAYALGYDNPSPGNPYADAGSFKDSRDLTQGDLLGLTRGVLERGHIIIDDYVPFIDPAGGSASRFDPTAGHQRMGLGVPPAMALLERLNTLMGDPGDLRNAVPGLLNANTASHTALRAVPMLTPSLDQYISRTDGTINNAWWWSGSAHSPQADAATALLGYRDKLPSAQLRVGPGFAGASTLDFSDEAGGLFGGENGRALSTLISGLPETPGFRAVGEILAARVIDASRTTGNADRRANIDRLGFNEASIHRAGVSNTRYDAVPGVVRHRRAGGPGAGNPIQLYADFDLDPNGSYAGQQIMIIRAAEPRNVGQLRTIAAYDPTNRVINLDRALPSGLSPGDEFIILYAEGDYGIDDGLHFDDRISDDFDERLHIAGAALNSISVRSDLYAVWFLLRGYTPDDVNGLQPDEPLIPSIERRFVMVVDRSNVVVRGDKPRILLFREVPL